MIYSNAFNFNSFMSGGVDPRTGVYTCSLSIGEIKSLALNGPVLPVHLSFNPLSGDSGFGDGWSLALTRYNASSQTLSLNSGEVYQAFETAEALSFHEIKLKALTVTKLSGGRYDVIYKNGQREELALYGTRSVAVPQRQVAANGAAISFAYNAINGQPVLSEVRDAQRVLLSITRTTAGVTLIQYPGSVREAVYSMEVKNGRVTRIDLPEGGAWKLQYQLFDGTSYLTRVDSPLGASEMITYQQIGHRFPPKAPLVSMPTVSTHTVYPGQDQPAISKSYLFSNANFLGYGGGINWSASGDNLYRINGEYGYTSTERLLLGGKVHSATERTYNKFHLLLSEVTTCGDLRRSSLTEFHLLANESFVFQPAQFRLPRVQTLRYENMTTGAFRDEVECTDYDEMGNLLRHLKPDGTSTVSTFYAAQGEEGCPADPLGFIRFEKQRTLSPALGEGTAAQVVIQYSYQLQPGLAGSSVANVVCVQQVQSEHAGAEPVLRSQTDFTYFNTPEDGLRHGLLESQSVIQNGLATHTQCTYTARDSELEVHKTLIGCDGTYSESSQTLCSLSGLKLSEENEDAAKTVCTYDAIGRSLSETLAIASEFEAVARSQYLPAKGQTTPTMLQNTDVSGMQQHVTYDGLGRVLCVEEQDKDHVSTAPMRKVYSAQYDALGHCTEEVYTDWLQGEALALKRTYEFSANEQLVTTLHQDGRKEYREVDPVLMRETQWLHGAGKTLTQFNLFSKIQSTEVFDLDGNSLGKTVNVYDGLGRCISQTDPVGNTTTYEFDVFDRLLRSVLPDGHAVETRYATHSSTSLPVEVTVAGVSLGTQVFDGLGRLTQSRIAGRETRLAYEKGATQPVVRHTPAGERIEYGYERNLGGRLIKRQVGDQVAEFGFHVLKGLLQSCTEQGRESRFDYFPSGHLKHEVSVHGEHEQRVSHVYSLGGRPLSYTDVLGNEHQTRYDFKTGRVTSFQHAGIKADFTYNALGQLLTVQAQDAATQAWVITRLAYDDLGREVLRCFEVSGTQTYTLASGYTQASKLAHRTLMHGQTVLRAESFTYDARGRLNHYGCEGTQCPCDPYGKAIISQTYVFDALDNLLTLETTFPGGENLATYGYSAVDPTQLVSISHSHKDYPPPAVLEYDLNGRLVTDEQSRTFTYDALGRLTQAASAAGKALRGYHYDAQDRLVELSQPDAAGTLRYYDEGELVNEVSGTQGSTCLVSSGVSLGRMQQGRGEKTRLFCTDQQRSVLSKVTSAVEGVAYSPYGHCPLEGGLFSLQAFNGESLDPVTGLYLLGNGYRAYSPILMRFQAPDSLSPFGIGGLNPYAYCLGDPINRIDPTGHWSWQSIFGIVMSAIGIIASVATFGAATPLAVMGLTLGVASGLTGMASAVASEVDPDSEAGGILGWVSLGLGVASAGAGLLATRSVATNGGRVFGKNFKGVNHKPIKASYAPGKGAKKAIKMQKSNLRDDPNVGKASTNRWRVSGPKEKNIKDGLTRDNLEQYQAFRDAMEHEGLSPVEASRRLGDPKYTVLRGKDMGLGEVRIGGGQRVLFRAFNDDFRVEILQVGGHL